MLLLSEILGIGPIRHRSGGFDPRDLHRNGRMAMNAMRRCRISATSGREREKSEGNRSHRKRCSSGFGFLSDSCRRAFHRPMRAHARQAQTTAFGALPILPCLVATTSLELESSLSLLIASRQLFQFGRGCGRPSTPSKRQ